jgi:hypothetical protein
MNNPDHISENLKSIFLVKILKFFVVDPGSGTEKIRIRDRKKLDPGSGIRDGKKSDPGSGINIPDPQHRVIQCMQSPKFVM